MDKQSERSWRIWHDIRALLTVILFVAIGVGVVLDAGFGLNGGWVVLIPIVAGMAFAIAGFIVLLSKRFNKFIWAIFSQSNVSEKDRVWLGWGLLILGSTTAGVWVYLLWPH